MNEEIAEPLYSNKIVMKIRAVPEDYDENISYSRISRENYANLNAWKKSEVKRLLKQSYNINLSDNLCIIIEDDGVPIIKAFSGMETSLLSLL